MNKHTNKSGKNIINIKHFSLDQLSNMPSRYRAKFINSLSGFKSANLIGTQNSDGLANLAIFSSVIHLGASPALVAFVMRPDNNARHTLNNIVSSQHYTINQVSVDFYSEAHQSSAPYAKNESEFDFVGLATDYIKDFSAPFVKESRLKYAVKLKEIMPIAYNNTQLIIGEIVHVICDENAIQDDGYIDIELLNTVCVSGLDSYHMSKRLSRLSYAKTNQVCVNLNINGTAIYSKKIRGTTV